MEFRVNYNFYEYGYSIETDDTAKHGLLQVMMQYKLRVSYQSFLEIFSNFYLMETFSTANVNLPDVVVLSIFIWSTCCTFIWHLPGNSKFFGLEKFFSRF